MKKWLYVVVIAVLAAGLWLYWECPMSLGKCLPEEAWIKMDMELQIQSNLAGDIRFSEIPVEQVLDQIDVTRVTRAREKRYLDEECFRITLYKGEAWPTVMYVGNTGRVDVAADMQFDDWKYYEGGEGLYHFLSFLSQNLPATYSIKE